MAPRYGRLFNGPHRHYYIIISTPLVSKICNAHLECQVMCEFLSCSIYKSNSFFFTAIIIVLELDMPLQSYLFQVPTQMCMCFCFEHPAQKYYQADKNYELDNTKHVD